MWPASSRHSEDEQRAGKNEELAEWEGNILSVQDRIKQEECDSWKGAFHLTPKDEHTDRQSEERLAGA